MAYVAFGARHLMVFEYLYVAQSDPLTLKKGSINVWTSVYGGRSLRDAALKEFHSSFHDSKCVLIRCLRPDGTVLEEVWPREGKACRALVARFANLVRSGETPF